MHIMHHIGLRVDERKQHGFSSAGIELELGITSFCISEDDARWHDVSNLARLYEAIDTTRTAFAVSELNAARCLVMSANWHHGYPESSDDRGYLRSTYDLTSYCECCGIGRLQNAPYRMARSPKWGRRSILQLNWVFDEYFATPEAWESVFAPFGIDKRPVLFHGSGKEIDSVVQLDIPTVVPVEVSGLPFDVCVQCGRKKYHHVTRGFFPKPEVTGSTAFKSLQYFGSGASAYRQVMVSNALYRKIAGAGIKGVDFGACAE